MHRRAPVVVMLALVVLLSAPWVPAATAALDVSATTAETATLALVNRERGAAGLAALTLTADLTTVARRHAATMAAQKTLFHNPALQQEVRSWLVLGENVGRGVSVEKIHEAFMASPTHRRDILDSRFTEVGIGVVLQAGEAWVVEDFRMPAPPTTAAPVLAAASAPTVVADQSGAGVDRPQATRTTTTEATRKRRAPTTTVPVTPETTTPPPPPEAAPDDPVAEVLGAALAAAAGSRPAELGSRAALAAAGPFAPSAPLPPLPVALAVCLLAAVVTAQVTTARRLRAEA